MKSTVSIRPELLSSMVFASCFVGLVAATGCADPLHGGETKSGGASGHGGVVGTGGINTSGGNTSAAGGAGGFTLPPMLTTAKRRACGNGVVEGPERCDDGNTEAGDGCSRTCQMEFGYDCPEAGKPCVLRRTCGDGALIPPEACDDGNTVPGDGCPEDCAGLERGWSCRVPGRPCRPVCGDGLAVGGEGCDDGNTVDGDGCSGACQVERCKATPIDGSPSCDAVGVRSFCGDGIVTPDEECDCGANGVTGLGCLTSNDDATYNGCTTQCAWGTYCGDGVVDGPESCDLGRKNGSVVGKDGCTVDCTIPPYCGDGALDFNLGEECDLGDRNGRPLGLNYEPDDSGVVYCAVDCRMLWPL